MGSMLIPHNPSKHLHRSGHLSVRRQGELDDVYIVVIPPAGGPQPDHVARAKPSGRSARLNPFAPAPKNEEERRPGPTLL